VRGSRVVAVIKNGTPDTGLVLICGTRTEHSNCLFPRLSLAISMAYVGHLVVTYSIKRTKELKEAYIPGHIQQPFHLRVWC
jgi:hypothetical protein